MNIIYQYPINQLNPHLFPVLEKEFAKLGVTSTNNPHEATHCFLNILSGVCKYDTYTLNIIEERKMPVINFDCREYGTMGSYTWDDIWLDPEISFVRNFNSTEKYPPKVYPFDWPYFEGCDYEPTTKEELFSRPFDYCLISVDSPTRKNIIRGIKGDSRLSGINTFLNCHNRLPYNKWVNQHATAKFFISADGGGYTNERPNQLFSVAAMIKNKSFHIAANPFTDMVNCIEINEHPTKEDIDKIVAVANDEDKLYEIYINGVNHMKKYYSPEAVAKRVFRIIYESRP